MTLYLYLSFYPDDPTVAARISACLADISCWMKNHHLQLNLAKTELLVVSTNPSFHHNFTFQLGLFTITPSKTARNLGVVMMISWISQTTLLKLPGPADLLYTILRRSGPFSRNMQHNSLFRLLFCPDLTIAMLSWQVFRQFHQTSTIIQNTAARLIFNEPKRTHVTPLFIRLHWLPIAARFKFKALTLPTEPPLALHPFT